MQRHWCKYETGQSCLQELNKQHPQKTSKRRFHTYRIAYLAALAAGTPGGVASPGGMQAMHPQVHASCSLSTVGLRDTWACSEVYACFSEFDAGPFWFHFDIDNLSITWYCNSLDLSFGVYHAIAGLEI